MEDMNKDQLWEQRVHTIVQIIANYINWSTNEQEKRMLEITETAFLE